MWPHQIKLAFRRLRKNRFIWINIIGLSLGIAVFIILFLFIQHENLYEKSHVKYERIYRVEQNKKEGDVFRKTVGVPTPTGYVIADDISGIEMATRFIDQFSGTIQFEDGSKVMMDDMIIADQNFLKIFTYPVIYGAVDGKQNQPYMAVISKESSIKLFGTENSVGTKINFGESDYEIQSVIEVPSEYSHLNFSMLISMETLISEDGVSEMNEDWNSNWIHSYALLREGENVESINTQLVDYLKKYQGEESENELYLKPLKDIHLKSEVTDEYAVVGSYQNNLIYMIIAGLIILIACINYINLTMAYSASRMKEIGIKKLIGANRFRLIWQLIGESGISLLIALMLALILIEIMLPTFNTLVDRQLNVGYMNNWMFYVVFISISLIIGLITGFVPAKTISGFQPLSLAQKTIVRGGRGNYFRYGLVLFQFFISISLISCTLLIFKQYHFLRNTDLGYDKEHVLTVGLNNPDVNKFRQFKTEAEQLSGIKHVGSSDYLPMWSTNYTWFTWEGAAPEEGLKMNINYVGPEFTDVYDITLANGNGFRPEIAEQEQMYVLLNETAIKDIGWEDDPVGKEIIWGLDYRGRTPRRAIIAGITEDYHYLSKHQPIKPIIMPMLRQDDAGWNLSIKLNPGNMKDQLADIEEIFKTTYPEELYNYQFADELVGRMYESEQKMSSLVLSLTSITIFIAILGLIGMVSYTATQKTKEIGIRKVNGASVSNIIQLISSDFIKLMLIGFLVSCPVSWMVMRNWFRNFAYQTSISWWVFALTLMGILFISFFAISFQTFKAAQRNPVDALRYE